MKNWSWIILALTLSSFQSGETYSDEELLGKISPASHPDFVRIESTYTTKDGIYIRAEAYKAFKDMYYDAKTCGIDLKIVSAMRTFNHQKSIWDRKWKRERYNGMSDKEKALDILTYSSMPGTSRHHWGTDIDLNSLNNEHFADGEGKKIYDWLVAGAAEYGFYQTYTPKEEGRTGYNEEKWHWTYLPISGPMLRAYQEQIDYADINGFSGSELAEDIGMIEKYVLGVNDKAR